MGLRYQGEKRKCFRCDSDTTYIQKPHNSKPYEDWRKDREGNTVCKKCFNKYGRDYLKEKPKRDIRNKQRITYKGKTVYMGFEIRIGVCNLCRNVVPFDTDRTDMHHEKYTDSDLLSGTLEVCRRCHTEQTWESGQFNTDKFKNRDVRAFNPRNQYGPIKVRNPRRA